MKPVQIKICIIILLIFLLASAIDISTASNIEVEQYRGINLAHLLSVFIQFAVSGTNETINLTNDLQEAPITDKDNNANIMIEISDRYTRISNAENISINTVRLKEKPVEVKDPHFKPLLYLEIHPDSSLNSRATIRIMNEWQRSDLMIYHYKGNDWQQLETSINGDFLEAVTDSFSIFAVGAPGGMNLHLQADSLILANDTVTVAGAVFYNNSTAAGAISIEITPSWSVPFNTTTDQQGNFIRTFRGPELLGNYSVSVNASAGNLNGTNTTTIQVTNATIYKTNASARIMNNRIVDPFANISFTLPENAVPELSNISLNLSSSTRIEVKVNNITLYNSTTGSTDLNLTGYLAQQNDINITANSPVNLTYTLALGFHMTKAAQVTKANYYSADLNVTNSMIYDWNNPSIMYHLPEGAYNVSVWDNSSNITGSSSISGNLLRIANSGIGKIFNNSFRNFKVNYNLKQLDINITLNREELESGETVFITPGVYFNGSMVSTIARVMIYRDSILVYDTNVSSGTPLTFSNTVAGVYNISASASANIDGVERTGSNRTFIHIKNLLIYANADPALSGRQIKITGRAYYTNNTGYQGTINISTGNGSYSTASNSEGYFSHYIPGRMAGTYTISSTASDGNYIAAANAISQVLDNYFYLIKADMPVISGDVTLAPDATLWINQTNITRASLYLYCKTAIHRIFDPFPSIAHKIIPTSLNSNISGTFNLPLYPYDYLEILGAFLNTTAEDPVNMVQDMAFNLTIDDREVNSSIIPHGDLYFTQSDNIKGFIPGFLNPGSTQTIKVFNKNTGSAQQYYFTEELYVDYIGHISSPCDLFLNMNNNFTYANIGNFTEATIDITGFKAASNNIRINNCRRTSIIGYNITLQKQFFGYTGHSIMEEPGRYNVTDTAIFAPGSNLTSVIVIIPLVERAKDVRVFVNGTDLTGNATIGENVELFLSEINSTKVINITYWTPILDFIPSVNRTQFNRGDTVQIKADVTHFGANVSDAAVYANISKAGAPVANVTLNYSYGGTYLADYTISSGANPGIYNVTVWAYNATTALDNENTTFMVRGLNITVNAGGPYVVDTNASITGYVRDLENSSGISGAQVNITIWNGTFSYSVTKTTNSTGYFNFSRPVDAAGDYDVTVNASDAGIIGKTNTSYRVKYKVNLPLQLSYNRNSSVNMNITVYDRSLMPVQGAAVNSTVKIGNASFYFNGNTNENGTYNFIFSNTSSVGYYNFTVNVSRAGVIGNTTSSFRVSDLRITAITQAQYQVGSTVVINGTVRDDETGIYPTGASVNVSINNGSVTIYNSTTTSSGNYTVSFKNVYSGVYSALVEVTFTSLVGTANTGFHMHYNSSTSISKTLYAPGEAVPINVSVRDANNSPGDAQVSINITKPDAGIENINSSTVNGYFNTTFNNASLGGDYLIKVYSSNASTSGHGEAADRSFRVTGFVVNVSTDRSPPSYRPGETVNISGVLRDTLGSPRTADVVIRINNYIGEVANATLTGRNGSYTWNRALAGDSPAGWYTATVNATTPEGVTASASAQFEVQLNIMLSASAQYNPGDPVNVTVSVKNGSVPEEAALNLAVQRFDIWNEFTGTYFDNKKMITSAPDCCIDMLDLSQSDELVFYAANLTSNNSWVGKAVQLNTSSLPSHFILDYEVSTGGTSSQLIARPSIGNATSLVRLNFINYTNDSQDGYSININGVQEYSKIENTNNLKTRFSIEYDTGTLRFYKNGEQFYQSKFSLPANSVIKLNGFALNQSNGSTAYLKYDNVTLYNLGAPVLNSGTADGGGGNYTFAFIAGMNGMYRINATAGNSSNYTTFKVRVLNLSSRVYGPYNFNESTLSNNTVIPLMVPGTVQDLETRAGITGAMVNITILQEGIPLTYRIASTNSGSFVLDFAGDLNSTAVGTFNVSVNVNDSGILAANNNSFRAYTVDQSWADTYMDYRVPILLYNNSDIAGSWHFDESSGDRPADSSGNGNDGIYLGETLNNGILNNFDFNSNSGWVKGNISGGLKFDGMNDYVNVSDSTGLRLAGTDFTISMWAYLTETPSIWRGLLFKTDWTNGWFIFHDATRLALRFHNGGTASVDANIFNSELNLSGWNYVTWTFNATTREVRVYLNGNYVRSSTSTITAGSFTGPLYFGSSGIVANSQNYPGRLDEVRIYGRSLSAGEIAQIYDNNSFIRNGMLGYWRFDETSGTAVYDTHHVITNDNKEGSKFKNALSFDGVNDYVRRPSGINLPLGRSPRTFMAWIKPASYPDTTYNGIVAYGKPECNKGSMLSIKNNGQLSMAFWCNDAYQTTGPAAALNEWSHAAFTYDGGTKVKFYMNGMFVQESILSGGLPDTADGPIRIGCTDDPGRCFNGIIDDARIYNRALSGNEIAGIYNSTDYQIWRPDAVSFDLAIPGGAAGGSAAIYDIERNLQSATIVDMGSHMNVTFTRPLSAYEGKTLYLYFERPAPVEPHSTAMSSRSAPYSVVNGAIEGYRLRIAPDKNVYSAGEPVILTTQLANVSGYGMIADITTTIYYPNGTIAQVNHTQTDMSGEASANYTIPALKGIFTAVTETSVFGITRKENTSFNVGDLVVHVSTDRKVYNTLENTNINLKVTQNDSITAADVTLKIYDPNNVKVFEETKNTRSSWTETTNEDFNSSTLSYVNVSGGSVTLATRPNGRYYTSGSLISKVYDGGSSIDWGKLSWSSTEHASDNITLYIRTSQNNISWSNWMPGIYEGDIQDSSRYIQYKAEFASTNDTKTPTLEDVTIEIALPVTSLYTLPDSPTGNYTLAVSATSSGNAGFNTTVIELDRFDISTATDKPVYTTNGNITVSGITNYRGAGANANVSLTVKKNLALNPSFETDIDSNAQPDGWIFAGSPWNGTGTRDTISRSGNYSVKVFRSVTNTTEGAWYYPNMYVISPNVNYTFSVWAKSDNIAGGNVRLWVTWYNGTTSQSTAINAPQTISAQNGWVMLQGSAMSPGNANNARVYLVSNIVGNAWFDDVTIEPENNPAVYASSTISSTSYDFTFSLASSGSYIVYSNGSYAATLNRSATTVFTVRSLDVNASAGGPFEPGAGSVTIKGYAVDNRTGMAIPNAAVQINITYPNGTLRTYTNTTNSTGYYTYTISTPRPGGTYAVSITAIDYQNVKGFSNTSFRVNLTLSVAANRTQYNLNETALILVNVSDSNSGISGAVVNISVKNPANIRTNFSTLYGNVTYQGNGVYTANYSGTDLGGNYTINATASNGTDNGSSNSSFMVRRLNVTIQGISVKVGESRSILARVEDDTTRNTTANATVNITIMNESSVVNQTTATSTNQPGYNIAAPLYTDRAGMYNIIMNVTDINNIKGQVVLSYTVNLSVDLVLDQTAYDPNENLKGTITIRDSITSMASGALVVTSFDYYNGTVISSNTTTSDSLGIAQVEFTAPSGYSSYNVKVTASKNGINGTASRLFATSSLRIWTDKGEAQIGGSAWGQNAAPEEYRNITIKVAALSSAGFRRTGQDLTARIYYPNGSLLGNYTLRESDKIYSGYVLLPGKNIPEGKYDIELAEYPGIRSNFSVMVWGCVNCHKPNSITYHNNNPPYYLHTDENIAPSKFNKNHTHRTLKYDGCSGGGCHSSSSTNCQGCHTFEGSMNPPTKCYVCHNSFGNNTQGYLNNSFGSDIHANINTKPGGQWYGKQTACESCHGILNSTQKPSVPLCTNCHPNSSGSDMNVMPGGLHGSNKTLEDFENIIDVLPVSGYRYSTVSITTDANNHSGSYSGKVDYSFGPGYGRIYIDRKNLDLTNATKIILWVYGDNSGINLSISLNNTRSTKISWHQSAPIQINWIGWRKISVNINELSQHDLMYITFADTVRVKLESNSEIGGSGTLFIDDLKKEAIGSHTQYDEVECGVCHGERHDIERAPQCQDCHQTQEHGWPTEDKYPGNNASCMECHQADSTQNRINISNISLHTELLENFESPQLFNTSLTYFSRSDVYYSGPLEDDGNHSARLDYAGLTGYHGNSINITNASKFKGISVFVNASSDPGTKLVLGAYTTRWNNYTISMDWNGWKQINVLYKNITINENVSFNATGTPSRIWMGVYGINISGTIFFDDLRQAVSDDYHQYESWKCTDCHIQIKNLPGITDIKSPITDCSICHDRKEPHYKQFTRVCMDCHFDSRHAEVEDGNFTNYEKASTCLKCHSVPHDFNQTHLETANCNQCHQQRIHGQNYQNVQYNSTKHLDCERCHGKTTAEAPLPIGLGSPRTTILRLSYTFNNETQCLYCHKDRIVSYELHINTSVNPSDQTLVGRILNDSICNDCHEAKSLLNESDRDELTAIDPKREPHAPQIEGHGNVSCYKCHGHRPETLTLNYGSNCVGCHQNKVELTELMPGTINNSRLSNITNPGAKQLIVHPPQVTGHGNASCSNCHGHVNSNLTYIGSKASDCANCHENLSTNNPLLPFRKPNSTRSTIKNPGGNPLNVNPPQVLGHGNTSCRECHEHAPSTFGGFNFIEGTICEDCHQNMSRNVSLIEDSVPKSNRTKLVDNHTAISPQVAGHGSAACSECHSHSAERMVYYGGKNADCIFCHYNESSKDTLLRNGSSVESTQITPHLDMNCTECHGHTPSNMTRINDCMLCHQNATKAQMLSETYGMGLNISSPPDNIMAVQIPLLKHSSSGLAGRKWNKTVAYWLNGSDSCQYCHAISPNYSDHDPLGRVSAIKGNNTRNSSLGGSYWCAACHYQGYSSGNVTYKDVVNTYVEAGLPVPPEITANASYGNYSISNDGVKYYAHGLSDYSDYSCVKCHGNAGNSIEFLHGVTEGTGGSECLNCHENATGPIENPNKYPAIVKSSFNKHQNINVTGGQDILDNYDCILCHYNTTNMDLPGWTTPTKKCIECHLQGNYSATKIDNHRQGGINIATTTGCSTCHNNSVNEYNYSNNASVSHYGTNSSLVKPTVNQTVIPVFGFTTQAGASAYNAPCNSCHNPPNTSYGIPTNVTQPHIRTATCNKCHTGAGADNLHNISLKMPRTNSCKDCHTTYADEYNAPNLTGTPMGSSYTSIQCEQCHWGNGDNYNGRLDSLTEHNNDRTQNPVNIGSTDTVYLNGQTVLIVTRGTIVTVTSRVNDMPNRQASRVKGAEYYIDIDPGSGLGVPMNAVDGYYNAAMGVWEDVTGTIDTSGLSDGNHTVYVRGMDIGKQWTSNRNVTLIVQSLGYINGSVTSGGMPVQGVNVSTTGSNYTTGSNGNYSLRVSAGTYTVNAIKRPGYYDYTVTGVVVTPFNTTTLNIALQEKTKGTITGTVRNG